MNTKLITLDNGLKIIICKDINKKVNMAKIVTNIGGLTDKLEDGTDIIPGTAHLMEHYICENNKYGIIEKELIKNKAFNANATTNETFTSFYFKTIDNFNNLLEILLDGVYTVSFDKERLDKTKIPVFSEIRDSKNNIDEKIYEEKTKGIFKKISNTLGDKEDIDNIDYKYLEKIYKNVYVPKNQILLLGGNFDIDEIINLVKKIYSKYKFNNYLKAITKNESSSIYIKEIYLKEKIQETYISYKFNLNNLSSIELYKLDIYLNQYVVINFSKYSHLNNKLKKDNVIINNIGCSLYHRNNCYILEISAYTKDSKKFVSYVENQIKNSDFSKDSFDLFNEQFRTTISIRSDEMEHYLMMILINYLSFNYFHIDSIEDVDKLDYNEYINYINKLDFSNRSILYIEE